MTTAILEQPTFTLHELETMLHSLDMLKLPPSQKSLLFEILIRYMGDEPLKFGYKEAGKLIHTSYRSTCKAAVELEKKGFIRRYSERDATLHVLRLEYLSERLQQAQDMEERMAQLDYWSHFRRLRSLQG